MHDSFYKGSGVTGHICKQAWMCHSFNKVFKIIAPGGNDWGYAEWLTRSYGLLLLLLLSPCRSQQFHFTFSLHFRRTGVNLQSWPFIISAWLAQSETSAGRTQTHLLPQLPEGDWFFFSLSLYIHYAGWWYIVIAAWIHDQQTGSRKLIASRLCVQMRVWTCLPPLPDNSRPVTSLSRGVGCRRAAHPAGHRTILIINASPVWKFLLSLTLAQLCVRDRWLMRLMQSQEWLCIMHQLHGFLLTLKYYFTEAFIL